MKLGVNTFLFAALFTAIPLTTFAVLSASSPSKDELEQILKQKSPSLVAQSQKQNKELTDMIQNALKR